MDRWTRAGQAPGRPAASRPGSKIGRYLFFFLAFAGSALAAVYLTPVLIRLWTGSPGPGTNSPKATTAQTSQTSNRPGSPEIVVVRPAGANPAPAPHEELDKKQLADIIGQRPLKADEIHTFNIKDEQGHSLFVQTTVDPGLQAWAVGLMPHIGAYATALVAINPRNGQVMVMASYRADGQPVNVALSSSFPAASLFKIVTAAAALEDKKMNSGSTLAYDGPKYTMYKKNVEKGIEDGRQKVTLKEGFADSINTVFGKLGAFTLGRKELESFAQKFHFNQPIDFEMPVDKSQFSTADKEDPYRLAELASGFNRTTTVSPLHGAMLASAILNDGWLMEPTVVKEVFDRDNRIYYQHEPNSLGQVVSSRTVEELRKLMRATITEGTGRRRFHDVAQHPVLKRLDIGGKSGHINDDQGRWVDWFVGFARQPDTSHALAVATVVVHPEKHGMASQDVVREAIIQYFRPRLKESKS